MGRGNVEIADYLRAIRRRWVVVVTATVLAMFLSTLLALFLPKEYESQASLVVTVRGSKAVTDLSSASAFLTAVLPTYVRLGSSSLVLDPVIRDLGLDTTSDDLAKQLTIQQSPETYVIDVTAKDATAQGASAIAGAVANEMGKQVPQLNKSSSSDVKISATLIGEATPPPVAASPNLLTNMAVGVPTGLLLGCIVAMLIEASRTTPASSEAGRSENAIDANDREPELNPATD